MLDLRLRRAHRRSPYRKFKPTDPLGERGARLEGRSLAAPAFWMQSNPTIPNMAQAITNGQVLTGGPFEWFLNQSQSLSAGTSTGTVVNDVPDQSWFDPLTNTLFLNHGVTYLMHAQAGAYVLDTPGPGNGGGPVALGDQSVSANTLNSLSWETIGVVGAPTVTSAIGSNASWSRSYFLADTDAAPSNDPTATVKTYASPTYLEETFDVTCLPPGLNSTVIPAGGAWLNTGPGATGNVPNGGLTVNVAAGAGGLGVPVVAVQGTNVQINPDASGSYATSISTPAYAVTVSGGRNTLHVVSTIAILPDALPYTTSAGPVGGPAWLAAGGSGLGAAGASSILNPTGQMSLSTVYHGSFSNTPITNVTFVPPQTPPPPPPPQFMMPPF